MRILFKNRRFEITLTPQELELGIKLPSKKFNTEILINDIYTISNGVYVSTKNYELRDKELYLQGEVIDSITVTTTACKEDFLKLNGLYYGIDGELTKQQEVASIFLADSFDIYTKSFKLSSIPDPYSNIILPDGGLEAQLAEKWELYYNIRNDMYNLVGFNVSD